MAKWTFSDANYKHYDPNEEGFGSAEEWAKIAEEIADKLGDSGAYSRKSKTRNNSRGNGRTSTRSVRGKANLRPDLEILFLDSLPNSIQDLKRAFRNTLMIVHPDHGGSNQATIAALEAYSRLLEVVENSE